MPTKLSWPNLSWIDQVFQKFRVPVLKGLFLQRLPARLPHGAIFELFGIEPEPNFGVTGRHHFCKHPLTFIFTIHYLKVSPSHLGLSGCPLGTNEMRKLLLFGHNRLHTDCKTLLLRVILQNLVCHFGNLAGVRAMGQFRTKPLQMKPFEQYGRLKDRTLAG